MNKRQFTSTVQEYLIDQGVPVKDFHVSQVKNLLIALPEYFPNVPQDLLHKLDVLTAIEYDLSNQQWLLKNISGRICAHNSKSIWSS